MVSSPKSWQVTIAATKLTSLNFNNCLCDVRTILEHLRSAVHQACLLFPSGSWWLSKSLLMAFRFFRSQSNDR